KPVKSVTFSASQGARQLGLGLYDAGIRDPETLIGVRRTTIAWRKTLADIFDLPGATTDWGWSIERVDGRGVFVGSVGWNPVSETGGKQVFDLARTETAGFRIRNGKVVWRNVGTSYACGQLPCPGAFRPRGLVLGAGQAPSLGVRMRVTGTLTQPPNAGYVLSRDMTVTLEGFDYASGRTRWTFDAGRNV